MCPLTIPKCGPGTAILGLSAFYHDSAAAVVRDGEILAAAQEERFTRKKHDASFPANAVRYCLDAASITPSELSCVAFYEKPLQKFSRLAETYLAFAPHGFASFRRAAPLWCRQKLWLARTIRRSLNLPAAVPILFTSHHESHASSAFFPSPYNEAAILTIDGVGEWSTTTLGTGRHNRIELTHHLRFPHSLGLLYSAFTYYCGFKVNSGEYKLMGLAPYGEPVYQSTICDRLIDAKPDGSFWLNMDYFNYCQGLTMTNSRFERLFGGQRRQPDGMIEQRHMDLAASIQGVTSELMLRMGHTLHRRTRQKNLVLAGGVALNCVGNSRLLREGPFDNIWIQPAAGDAGGSLGAALFAWYEIFGQPRYASGQDFQKGSFLGPRWSSTDIEQFLQFKDVRYTWIEDEDDLVERVASLLQDQYVVGWFHGRMEFGPRALGARSILADPRSPRMQSLVNTKIKFRESFRPFAPAVLQQDAAEWFGLTPSEESPYMLFIAPVLEQHRLPLSADEQRTVSADPDLRARINVLRSVIPAVTHVDYSARVQTVDRERNSRFFKLLTAFAQRTGQPLLLNTSFNVRSEPIVCTAEDAYRCFLATNMDALVLENAIVLKENVKDALDVEKQFDNVAQFDLD
jgi:carbamoyltransferase